MSHTPGRERIEHALESGVWNGKSLSARDTASLLNALSHLPEPPPPGSLKDQSFGLGRGALVLTPILFDHAGNPYAEPRWRIDHRPSDGSGFRTGTEHLTAQELVSFLAGYLSASVAEYEPPPQKRGHHEPEHTHTDPPLLAEAVRA